MKYLVYLAGPITGCSFNGCVGWREYVISKLPPEIIGLSPLRGKTYLEGLDEIALAYDDKSNCNEKSSVLHLKGVMSSDRGITSRDFNDCRRADALLVNLLGATRVSIGTVMEIAWAKAFNIPVIAVLEESGNVHEHGMITECINFRVSNIEDGIRVLNMVLLPVPHVENQ